MGTSRILIVDDSPVVCRLVASAIEADPDLEVCGRAANGREMLTQIRAARPDAVVLDLDMPIMDGAQAYQQLRLHHADVGVVVFSNFVPNDACQLRQAIDADEIGYVHKPVVTNLDEALGKLRTELLPTLRRFSTRGSAPLRDTLRPTTCQPIDAVAIGASTGGPHALEKLFADLSHPLPVPIFIVDHIQADFTDQLVANLDRRGAFDVVAAEHGLQPEPGVAYLAPGDWHLRLARTQTGVTMVLDQNLPVHSCRPSVDVLFESMAGVYGPNQLGVVLTGMGEDGVAGCRGHVGCWGSGHRPGRGHQRGLGHARRRGPSGAGRRRGTDPRHGRQYR